MSFDELSSTSERLNHPTANRPKMPGRRLPAQFGGAHSVRILDYFTALFCHRTVAGRLQTQALRGGSLF